MFSVNAYETTQHAGKLNLRSAVAIYKLDEKYSEIVQLPAKAIFGFFCHLATLATPTIRSIKCKQSPVYGVF